MGGILNSERDVSGQAAGSPASQSVGHTAVQAIGQSINHSTSQSIGSSLVGGEAVNTKVGVKTKIIKRYQNRKLYDTQQSCYVTLDDIAKMIRTNEDVMVIDNKSKNDITAATLTQIIFESEKKASAYAPLFTLREIIQNGNGSISSYLAKLGAFPQDYAQQEVPAPALERASFEDVKQSLENRVARAAADTASEFNSASGSKFTDDQTPSLPNSNKSLNN
jgi:polyhydroxyalkanoate synthesis repressor PhaR